MTSPVLIRRKTGLVETGKIRSVLAVQMRQATRQSSAVERHMPAA